MNVSRQAVEFRVTRAAAWFLLAAGLAVLVVSWWSRPLHMAEVTPASPALTLHVNTASADRLEALHGIGPALAEAIALHREHHGAFAHPDDLLAVSGIGPATLRRITPWISF